MLVSRRGFLGLGAGAAAAVLAGCAGHSGGSGARGNDGVASVDSSASGGASGAIDAVGEKDPSASSNASSSAGDSAGLGTFERGSRVDRGFEVDDTLGATPAGDIHFSLHVPDSYDGSRPFSLYVHCPGWEGLYFQGVGANLQEDFPFVSNDYVDDMIVACPQFDDWEETSADMCVVLTRWLLANYNVDPKRVYLSGYSGGGETVSLVTDRAPELYRRVLHMSSKWDGSGDALVKARVPLRMSVGKSDEYYGSDPDEETYRELRQKYRDAGVSGERIDSLLVLDVKPDSYFDSFTGGGSYHEHTGGAVLFAQDRDVMGWLFK